MALTRIKTNQITDLNVTNAKLANASIQGGKLATNLVYGSNLTVSGDLTVSGTTTSISTTNTRVEDAVLALSAEASGTASVDAGLLINRGSDDNYAFLWDESEDEFILANVGAEAGDTNGNIVIASYADLKAGQIDMATLAIGGVAVSSTAAELNLVDGSGAGTVVNSKAVIYGAGGEVNATALQVGGVAITATPVEINLLDNATVTTTEINNIDGDTAATVTTVADGDAVVYNDGGTMMQVAVEDLSAYFDDKITAMPNLTSTGTLTGLTVSGATNLNGDVDLGDDAADAISIVGSATFTPSAAFAGGFTVSATQTVDMGANKVTNVAAPTANTDAATKLYVDTADALKLDLAGGTMSGAIAMGASKITGMDDPTADQDAATKIYVDTEDALKLNLAGGTMSGAIAMGTNAITGMADPTNAQDAATKAYADSLVAATTTVTDGSGSDTFVIGDTITFTATANETDIAVTAGAGGPIVTIGMPNDVTVGNDLTVTGNLTVNGTTTTLSTTNSVVGDSLIELNNGALSNANDLGFIFERGSTGDNAVFAWDETNDKFTLGTTAATGAATGALTIATGTLVAALEGNADTATALETARTIAVAGDVVGSASFDGTGNISISTTIQADSVALGTDTTGNYVLSLADSGEGIFTITNGVAEGGVATIALAADSVALGTKTTGNYVQSISDAGSSQFTIVDGATEGGAATIALANDAVALGTHTTGNYVLSLADAGSSQFTITNGVAEGGAATIALANDAVTMGTHTTGNYVATIAGGNGIASTGATSGETIAHSLSVDLTDTTTFASDGTASRAVVLDANGDFTATTATFTNMDGILGANSAAAATVTSLDVSLLASLDGGIDVDGAFTVANTSGNIATTGTAAIGGAASAGSTLTVAGTDSLMVAKGTTAQRPTPVTGMFRYNTTTNQLEYYDNASWKSISPDFTLATSQTFNGDGSTVAFTLSALTGADSYTVAGVLVMLNGVVQEPTNVYGITGTTLTFTEAPVSGDLIEVRKFTTTSTVVAIADTDGDTLINVETSPDEDVIRFSTAGTERMTIGATGNVTMNHDLTVTGDFTLAGNITLGDASSDTITINADFAGNLIPDADGTRTLGDATNKYATAFIDDVVLGPQGDVQFSDADSSNYVAFQGPATVASNITWTLPAADAAVSGYALVSDAAGTLDWAAAGATTTSDTTTNAEEHLYFSDITTGAVTAVHHNANLTFNPNTSTLSSTTFAGALSGNATSATALETARTIGGVSFDGSANINLPGVNAAGNQDTSGNAATATALETARTIAGNSFDGTANITIASTDLSDTSGLARLAGPAFTGVPTAPTAAANTNTTQIATTAYVQTEITDLIGGAPGALDTLNELAAAINDDSSFASTVTTLLGGKVGTTSNQALSTAANVLTNSGATISLARASGDTDSVTLSLADLGYTGATNANYITNNNQLTNGAGYTTNTGDITNVSVSGSGLSGGGASGSVTITSNATSANTGNTIVFRDGSGNFSAGLITGTSTAARYADLAEMYAADAEIEPGTVVHFAGEGKVEACDIENCRAVAGIVSTDPAHLMNAEQEGVALALAGRVPCKVTGPVAAGDLMVSAGNGMAMANNDAKMGTVIGKAIEAHAGGEGVIEVLALMM